MGVRKRSHRYNSTTSSSARIRHKIWTPHKAQSVSLGPKGIQSCKIAAAQVSQTQESYPEHLTNDIDGDSNADWEMADSVLTGQTEASMSHAGGEWHSLLEEWVRDTERRRYEPTSSLILQC